MSGRESKVKKGAYSTLTLHPQLQPNAGVEQLPVRKPCETASLSNGEAPDGAEWVADLAAAIQAVGILGHLTLPRR